VTDVRVLVADDHVPTRQGIRLALEGHGFEICAEAADAGSAVTEARRVKPDLCLLDIRMPGNGISAAAAIANDVPQTAIVMLTVSRDDEDLFAALRCGASGYLLKDLDAAQLRTALLAVERGEATLSGTLVARVVDEFRSRDQDARRPRLRRRPDAQLTAREWLVLELLRDGLTTVEIAVQLFVEPVTVRGHIASIMRKLRVRTRAEAIRLLEER
jgi:DNA-binding NarL/FixJ family response regulator